MDKDRIDWEITFARRIFVSRNIATFGNCYLLAPNGKEKALQETSCESTKNLGMENGRRVVVFEKSVGSLNVDKVAVLIKAVKVWLTEVHNPKTICRWRVIAQLYKKMSPLSSLFNIFPSSM